MSAEYMADPYPFCARLVESYPLLWNEALQAYVVSRFTDVSRVLKDPVFTTKPYDQWAAGIHGRTIVNMEGREHSTHRAIVMPALRGKDLQSQVVPIIERIAADLIADFRDQGQADLVADFTARYPITVVRQLLGLPDSAQRKFVRWYKSIIAFFYNLAGDPAVIEDGMRTKAEIEDYIVPLAHERRANPRDDLLTVLSTAEVDGVRMTDAEVKAFVSLLIVGGGETTDNSMGSMLRYLISHPDQLAAVRADRSLIAKAFAETLRMAPPVQVVPRYASEDVELSGGIVPAGSQVFTMLNAANRDPSRWRDPQTFNIFREDLNHTKGFAATGEVVSFGLGRHFCIGSILARHEVEIGTNLLLDAMDDIRFTDGVPPSEVGMFARGPESLKVSFTPR
jgi:pulcherriminic acid synthase